MSDCGSIDYLSHCSSLSDILSLLEWKDISNCVLVSHRLQEVIMKNYLYKGMPVKCEILSELDEDETLEVMCIKLRAPEERVIIYIADSQITMVARDSASNDIRDRILQTLKSKWTSWGEEIRPNESIITSKMFRDNKSDGSCNYYQFENESIGNGLKILLTHLFMRYRLKRLVMGRWRENCHNSLSRRRVVNESGHVAGTIFPLNIYAVVEDELRRRRCRCEQLEVDQPFPELHQLYTSLDSKVVVIYCAEELNSLLDSIETWDRCYVIDVPLINLDTMRIVYRLVKRYLAGHFHINCLQLLQRSHFGENINRIARHDIDTLLDFPLLGHTVLSIPRQHSATSYTNEQHFMIRGNVPIRENTTPRLTVSYTHMDSEYNIICLQITSYALLPVDYMRVTDIL